jgi:hypothetical protein
VDIISLFCVQLILPMCDSGGYHQLFYSFMNEMISRDACLFKDQS